MNKNRIEEIVANIILTEIAKGKTLGEASETAEQTIKIIDESTTKLISIIKNGENKK